MARHSSLLLVTAASVTMIVASGCILGRSIAAFEPARTPKGISVVISARSGAAFRGELLAVSDSGLLMMVDERIAFVYRDAINSVKPGPGAEGFLVRDRELSAIPAAQQLIPLSRYPAGITHSVLSRMLSACSQDRPELVRAPR